MDKIKKIHLLPNLITAFGLCCGLFVIFRTNIQEPTVTPYIYLYNAILILLLAGLADFLDGAVAKAIKAESEFGATFDCISDGIVFGVAPSVLVLKTFDFSAQPELSFLVMGSAMVFTLCGILRLVRFSVTNKQAEGNVEMMMAHKKNFTGLPIPGSAGAALAMNLFFLSPLVNLSEDIRALWSALTLILLGYLMVSRWKFPSLKMLHLRIPSFPMAFVITLFTVLLFFGVLYYFSIAMLVITWGYIALGLTLSATRWIAGKRAAMLQDFESDEEDI